LPATAVVDFFPQISALMSQKRALVHLVPIRYNLCN
jgi:hypothetical protein